MGVKDDKLQRYFDGELDERERVAFEAAMTVEDQERLAALAEMRVLLNVALDARAADVDIWSGVQAGLAKEKQSSLKRWRQRARGRGAIGTAAGLMAAAAALFLFLAHPWHPAHASNDCDVESLEVEGAVATVITLPDQPHSGDGTTTIIWAEETEEN
jgi:anti-sigma factor RsiW